jgi:nucleoid-associated protein YgaU
LTIAFGAAAATVVVVLGILAVPALNACTGDSRGLVTCIRDIVQQRFDLPGTVRTEALAPPAVTSPGPEPRLAAEAEPDAPADTQASEVQSADAPLGQGGPFLPPEPVPPRYAPQTPERIADLEPTRANEPSPSPRQIQPALAPVENDASPVESAETVPSPPEPLDQPSAQETGEAPEVTPAVVDTVEPPVLRSPPTPDRAPQPDPLHQPSAQETQEPPAVSPSHADIVDPPPTDTAIAPVPAPPPVEPTPEPPTSAPQELVVAAGPEPEPLQPVPPTAAPLAFAPTIDAIELDGARSFVSGTGPAGALMRLFSDDEIVGESQVEEGRWLVETGPLLTSPRHELKVEAFDPDTGRSLGQSAITIEIELPPDAPPFEQDSGPAPSPPAAPPPAPREQRAPAQSVPPLSQPAADPEPVPEPEPGWAPETTAELPPVSVEVEAPAPDITTAPPPADEAIVPGPHRDSPPTTLPPLVPVTPQRETGSVTILGDTAASPSTSQIVPREPAIRADFDTPRPPGQPFTILRLYPLGDPVYGRFSGGQAIIRRGDTLWTLARRYYGSGIHYRTILEANRDQIRRPSRIFPGQVLDLPLVTRD